MKNKKNKIKKLSDKEKIERLERIVDNQQQWLQNLTQCFNTHQHQVPNIIITPTQYRSWPW